MKLDFQKLITGWLASMAFMMFLVYMGIEPILAGLIAGIVGGIVMPNPWTTK